jgi:hypothetical protein
MVYLKTSLEGSSEKSYSSKNGCFAKDDDDDIANCVDIYHFVYVSFLIIQ